MNTVFDQGNPLIQWVVLLSDGTKIVQGILNNIDHWKNLRTLVYTPSIKSLRVIKNGELIFEMPKPYTKLWYSKKIIAILSNGLAIEKLYYGFGSANNSNLFTIYWFDDRGNLIRSEKREVNNKDIAVYEI